MDVFIFDSQKQQFRSLRAERRWWSIDRGRALLGPYPNKEIVFDWDPAKLQDGYVCGLLIRGGPIGLLATFPNRYLPCPDACMYTDTAEIGDMVATDLRDQALYMPVEHFCVFRYAGYSLRVLRDNSIELLQRDETDSDLEDTAPYRLVGHLLSDSIQHNGAPWTERLSRYRLQSTGSVPGEQSTVIRILDRNGQEYQTSLPVWRIFEKTKVQGIPFN